MSYAVYDFSESLDRVGIDRKSVARVVAAWGFSGDYGEWEGGFVMEMTDGRFAYVWGWCDTSGWGCQDGAEVEWSDALPELKIKRATPQHMSGYIEQLFGGRSPAWGEEWDENPADLNRYIRGEIDKW
jgi:hypothetical protein